MNEIREIIFVLMLFGFFTSNRSAWTTWIFIFVGQTPVVIRTAASLHTRRHARTHLGVGAATHITQASLLNCGGSSIVLAIGSVLLWYSKRFCFLTAQQCLINPGMGDVDAGHWPRHKRGEFGKRLRVIMNSILTQQFNLLACQYWPSANPSESLISPVSLFFFSFPPSFPPPLPSHSLTLLLPLSFILMLTESVRE